MKTTTGEAPPHLRLMVRSGRHEQERFVVVHGRTMTMSVLAVGETLSVRSPNNTALTFCLLAQTTTDEKDYLLSSCLLVAPHDNTHTHIHTSSNCHHGPLHVNTGKMPCRFNEDNDGGVVVVDSEALAPMFGLCGGLLRMRTTTSSRTCSRFYGMTKQK